MSNLGSAKIMGGIGAILMLVGGFVPTGFLSIVGFILVVVAVKYISDEVRDKSIFINFLLFVILNIVAVIAIFALVFYAIGGWSYFAVFTSAEFTITDYNSFINFLEDILIICILGFVIYWILSIVAALFLKKSFDSITKFTRVDLFKTTGLVYLIGAFLLIIGIGAFIILIADILMIIAFFSLPDTLQPAGRVAPPGAPVYPQQPPQQQSGRMCTACGRPIPMDAQVCPYCGKDFRQQ
jgi:uncharacterized membrane protein